MGKNGILAMLMKENGFVPKPMEYLAPLDINVLMGHLEVKKMHMQGIISMERQSH